MSQHDDGKKANLRKKLLINPKFQGSFLAYTIGIAIVLNIFFISAIQFFFWKCTQLGDEAGLPKTHTFFQFLSTQQILMNWIFFAFSIVVVLVLGIYGLYLSNRIAGPIFRLEQFLIALAAGQQNPDLQFRKKDYFQELVIPIRDLAKRLQSTKL